MNFPPPTEQQARLIWFGVAALALAVIAAVLGAAVWRLGWVLNMLSPVLMPLAIAGILAYLLDPLVDFFVRWMPRTRAIVCVFALAIAIVIGLLGTVVPRLVVESRELVRRIPEYTRHIQDRVQRFMAESPLVKQVDLPWLQPPSGPAQASPEPAAAEPAAEEAAPEAAAAAQSSDLPAKLLGWVAAILPDIGRWLVEQVRRVASWFGVLLGLALIPVYLFYFLREKEGIVRGWTDYLPVRNSRLKEEIIFIIRAINDSLIVFFRGQVLVALCSGTLLTIGFLAMGLNYAFLLGALAAVFGIIPYLGVLISIVPAVSLAAVQFGDWLHPVLVLGLFALVNALEGFVISPKIIGDRVGLHPLTIIIALMVGTTLLGGILGGILAIPLTAALRAILERYVWRRGNAAGTAPAVTASG